MALTLILSETERITVNGRLEAIYRRLLAARADIEAQRTVKLEVDCGEKPQDVHIVVPKRY